MVINREWVDTVAARLLNVSPRQLDESLEEESVNEVKFEIDVLQKHGISFNQIHDATEWLRDRREDYRKQWEDAESEYQGVRDRAEEATGPKRDDLIVVAEEKRRDAEDRRRQWERVSSRFQFFRRIERQVENKLEKRRFQEETDEVMSNMDEVMQDLAEEFHDERRSEDKVVSNVEQRLEDIESVDHMTPDTSRVREDIAEQELADTELGVGTGYGEDLLEEDREEEEYQVDTGGETL